MRTALGPSLCAALSVFCLGLAADSRAETLVDSDFDAGLGVWSDVGGDDFDWTHNSGGTPSSSTGPSGDHTTGVGYYVYTESSSPNYPNETALLQGPCLDLTGGGDATWTFWYHMYGSGMGALYAEVAAGCGTSWTPEFSLSGDQGSSWHEASVDLSAYVGTSIAIRFRGVTGSSYRSDMAVDDVLVEATPAIACTENWECDDGVACTDDVCGVSGYCEPSTDNCPGDAICNLGAGTCEMPAAQPLVDALDIDQFKAHIAHLSSSDPPIDGSRRWDAPGNAATLDYIEAELESYGYNVVRHSYTYSSQTKENVYATKVGATNPDEMYIVSAHMDSYNTESDPVVFAPGANDDGSGTALVLEAARVFADPSVTSQYSIRFILWNNEETGLNGAEAYVSDRGSLQGVESPPGSGVYPEPAWRGVLAHDMMLWDHGCCPDGDEQIPGADVDIEYQASSSQAAASLALANALFDANVSYATDYPSEVSDEMCCTDSVAFEDHVASVSLRENRRLAEIGNGADRNWHKDSDVYSTYSDLDFLLGFNALQTTVGAIAELAGATLASTCGDGTLDAGEDCDDGNTDPGDCCSATCHYESTSTVCRAAVDVCDVAETCDGAGACPADAFEPVTAECRAAAGVCDAAESCDGVGAACPADAKLTGECRSSAGVCDVAEFCDGVADDCPADAFEPVTTECRAAAGVCDAAESCDGVGAGCPADAKLTGECRASAGTTVRPIRSWTPSRVPTAISATATRSARPAAAWGGRRWCVTTPTSAPPKAATRSRAV
jgi:cysteine-rich repeat protein